ncbi:MAG: hypothetical protein OEW95_08980 [Candidatus Bathyarchaeota archaeon]|nr:hypothetical protein [Candidatus Bathyarchaeota archaeon]
MPLSEKHEATAKLVSEVFREAGYKVQFNKPIGPPSRRHYVDVIALGPRDAFIIEVKVGIRTGSSDVMAMESFVRRTQSEPFLRGKTVKGIITSPGTLDPAKMLSDEWGITVIEGNSPQEIKQGLHQFLKKR